MNKKYLFIVLTLSILLIGLGVASANTDYNDDTTIDKSATTSNSKSINEDKNVKKISNEVTNKKNDQEKNLQTKQKNITKNKEKQNYKTEANTENVNNFSSLKEAMTSTLYDEVTININDNITLDSSIDLSRNITKLNINGNGKTIDGNNQYYFIKTISEVDLTINNLNFINCKNTNHGGAIHVSNTSTVIIDNCEFSNIMSEYNGGAIHVAANSNVTIKNSEFSNINSKYRGGAINVLSYSMVTIEDCEFSNIKSDYNGGAINVESYSNSSVNNCNFWNVESESDGGALSIGSNCIFTMNNSIFTNTSGSNGGTIYFGGASNVTINNSKFRNNTARFSGAVIHTPYSQQDYIKFNGCEFTNNTASGSGGAISANNVMVEDCNFTRNKAGVYGGVFYGSSATFLSIRSNFTENSAESSYGVINAGEVTILDSKFIGNHAKDGGVLAATNVEINNSLFKDNWADKNYGVMRVARKLHATHSEFINNSATNEVICTFLVISGEFTDVYLDNIKFINNTSKSDSLINFLRTAKVFMTNNIFMCNTASNGAGIYISTLSEMNMTNNNFTGNTASSGAGVYVGSNVVVNMTNNNFTDNKASNGGGVYVGSNSVVNMTDNRFTGNTATGVGGALCAVDSNRINMSNNIFTENSAGNRAGAVYVQEKSVLYSNEDNFIKNTATNGGAIQGQLDSVTINIQNSNFTANNASYGGAINGSAQIKINNSIFKEQLATISGGAINTIYGVEINNSKFINNTANHFGGAISVEKDANVFIDNTLLLQNDANYAGAVYGYLESTINIQNSNFTENGADNGGAIGTNGTVTISYSNFTGNHANQTGGAIECGSDLARLTVQASNFTDNYVKSNDGYVVDFSKSKYVVVKDNTFKNNTDDKRDMLFSEVNNLAISDINGNDYVDNYLETTITPLDNVEITHKDDVTFNYPVNVTLRSVYNHTINTGSLLYEYNHINNASDVINNQSEINVHNKDLQLPVNIVNYVYHSLNKNYQSSNDKFNINKLISTNLTMQLDPEEKVNVGETVKVTITLEDIDGTRLAQREIGVEVNGIPYDLGINNKTDANGQLIFDYYVENFTINNIMGEIIFTAKFLETDPESFYDSATNIEKSINISEIPTHIHIDHNNEDVREGNTFNVTILLCSDETSHEHIVGELIHYKITNMNQTVTINEGNFTSNGDGYNITIENLPEQGYKVFAWFDGSNMYDQSAGETDVIPNYNGTEVEIIIPTGTVYVNQTRTITIMLEDSNENPLPADHVVFVTINNGEEIRVSVVDGVGTFNYTSNISAKINITARFNKTDIYSGSKANSSYPVVELPTHTTLELINDKVGNTIIRATVLDTVNNKPVNGGNITLTLPDGTNITEQIENEEAIFHITTLLEGEYDLEVKFNGIDLVYVSSDQNTHKINITKTPTETIIENMTVMVTENNITINVEIKDENNQNITTGTVQITVNEETHPAQIEDGKANITINNLPKGKHTINATYIGNGTYETSNTTATITVLPEPTKSQVEILDTTLGNLTIKVTVTDLNNNKVNIGNVTIMDRQGLIIPELEEKVLTNGEAIITIPTTTTGLTKIKVHYNENEIYGESEAVDEDGNNPINIDVTKIPTITKIETLNTTFSNVTIRVTVTNKTGEKVPEGMVQIRYGNGGTNYAEIKNGIVEFNIPTENVGTIIVRAQYVGTENYMTSRARNESLPMGDLDEYDHKIEVTPLETQITATANNGTNTKTSVDVTLKDEQQRELANAPVTIRTLDGTQIADGTTNNKGEINIPVKLPAGNTILQIEFAGNSTHKASNTTTQITTQKHDNNINPTDDGNGILNINLTDDDDKAVSDMPVNITLSDGTFVANGTTDENGNVNITIPLPPGTYDLNITTPGDDNNNPANSTVQVTIPRIPTQISAIANNGTNTQTNLDIILTDENNNPISETQVFITDKDGNPIANGTTDKDGKVNIPVVLPTGTADLTITYPGNDTYITSNTTAQITTVKHDNTIDARDDNNGTLIVNVTDDDKKSVPNMPVNVTLSDGTFVANGTTDENGNVNITIPLPPGTYDLNISTPGDDINNPANMTTQITIPRIPTQISAIANNGTNTQTNLDIILTDENNNPISETQVFITDKDGNPIANGTTDKDGKVNIPVVLPTGTADLTITYPGNDTYITSNTTAQITTVKHDNTIDAKDDNKGTLNINLTDDDKKIVPNMPVKVTLLNGTQIANGTTDKDGKVSMILPLEPGDYIVNITTPGNEDNNPANKIIPVSIPPKDTKMDVKVNNGTEPTVDVKLTDGEGKPIGVAPITIKDKNGKQIGEGITKLDGTVNIPIDIPVGTQDITVNYPGNRTYKSANKTAPARKDKETPVMDVTVDPNGTVKVKITDEKGKAIPGLPVNITDEKGNVIGNGTTDKDGIVTTPTKLTPGPHNVTASTPGNDNIKPANKTVPAVIPPKDTKLNTTVLDPTLGNTTIKVNLTDKDNKAIPNAPITVTLPNGTKVPATTRADGTVEIPVNLPVGNNQIKIDYPGNQTYKPASQTVPVNVQKTPTTTTIAVVNNTAGNVRVTGTVKDKNGRNVNEGTITIKNGNTVVGTGKVTNGAYTITTNMASKGTYTLKAEYAETNNYLSSSNTTTLTVNPKTPTLTVQPVGSNVGNTSIIATLKDSEGKAMSNAPIIVTLPNGTKVTGTTNNNGVVNIPLDLREGNNNLTINYPGNATYNPVTTKTNMKVSKNNPIIILDPVRGVIGEDITLTAYLTDKDGSKITGGNLVFKLNGKSLRSDGRFDSNAPAMKLSVKDGKVSITLKADLYLRNAKNLTASYSGNYKYVETNSPTVEAQIQKRYAGVTVTVTPTLNKQYDTIKFTATVRDTTKNGKNTTLINKDTKVMFKVNGVTLKDKDGKTLYVPVNANKQATYNYVIPAGTGGITATKKVRDYKVDAIFVGDNYYPGARNNSKFNVERSATYVNITQARVTSSNVLSVKATLKDFKGNNLIGTNKVTVKVNGKSYIDPKNGKPKYWSVKNGVVDLTGIQIDSNTTIKRVMVVTGERQAYLEGRNETTNIIRV